MNARTWYALHFITCRGLALRVLSRVFAAWRSGGSSRGVVATRETRGSGGECDWVRMSGKIDGKRCRRHKLLTDEHARANLFLARAAVVEEEGSGDTGVRGVAQEKCDDVDVGVWDVHGQQIPAVPLVAVYGHAYIPCYPKALVALPTTEHYLRTALPLECYRVVERESRCTRGPSGIAKEAADSAAQCCMTEDSGRYTCFYLVIHGQPVLQPCQKFLCSNSDEVNMMYHAWLCGPRNARTSVQPLGPDTSCNVKLRMGVFGACGVRPVHGELEDAGVSFDSLSPRSVVIHDCCFSPENAMMQLTECDGVATFVSVAVDDNAGRVVVVMHVLPLTDGIESKVERCCREAESVSQLVRSIADCVPSLALRLHCLNVAEGPTVQPPT